MARRILSRAQVAALALVASAATVLGGCSAGGPRSCSVTCSAAGECPDGTSCGPDLYCYSPQETPGSCALAGEPDGGGGDGVGDDGSDDGSDGSDDGGDDSGDDSGDDGGDDGPGCDPCDPVEQCGCVAGDGCYAGASGPACAQAGELGEEGLCTSDPDCSPGYGCAADGAVDGHCRRYCGEDGDCGGGVRLCSRAVPGSSTRICSSDCDPLDSAACGVGEKCTLDEGEDARYDARCLEHGGLVYLDICYDQPDCGPGYICVAVGPDFGTCEYLCTVGSAECGSVTCTGFATPLLFGGDEYGYCPF